MLEAQLTFHMFYTYNPPPKPKKNRRFKYIKFFLNLYTYSETYFKQGYIPVKSDAVHTLQLFVVFPKFQFSRESQMRT